jgi:endonuclease/exonuclease/phosphatase (EEP) superfamily protein YafD
MNGSSKQKFFHPSVQPWGLMAAAGIIACLATTLGFLGRFSWFLDLFSHFRVQYLVGLGILGALFLLGRRRRTAAVFIGFACINLGVVLPQYFGGPAPAIGVPASGGLRAMLLNVNTRLGNATRVRKAVQETEPDILVLEEINARWVTDLKCLADSYPYSVTQPREDNFGIGLFSKFPIAEQEVVHIGAAQVPSILATITVGQSRLRVIATHPLPPAGARYSRLRNEQLDRLPDCVSPSLPMVLLGDLNVTPWNYHFRRLLKRTGLIDSSRGRGIQPTWPSNNPLLLIPLDHFLHSSGVSVLSRRIGPNVSSDHYPLIVDFTIGAP